MTKLVKKIKMKNIHLLIITLFVVFNFIKAEDNIQYKQVPIQFNRLEADTLDVFIQKNGKKHLLKQLDSNITALNKLIKYSVENIKEDVLAFELSGLNKHYRLNLDSFLYFSEAVQITDQFYSIYSRKMGDTLPVIEHIEKMKNEKYDMNKDFIEGLYHNNTRIGFFTFCNYAVDAIKQSSIDTLYKAALIYPNVVRNEYYYALAEFDRNCGNAQNNAAFYKTQLYNKMKEDMSLEKALTDTNILSALNASKYILTPKYQFFAYSLYAKNFDIKANQKEIIYFLASQNKIDGGFKEYNLEKAEKTIKSKIEPTFYAFWALLELREQINALYPDDVKSQTTPVKNEPNNSSTKPTTKPTTKKK